MRLLLVAALAAGVLTLSAATACAQRTSESRASVVVLDVAAVFKSHARFKLRIDDVRKDRDLLQKDFIQQRETITSQSTRLKDFKSGSPEYKQIEDRVNRELAELQLKTFSRQRELLEWEGKIYHETYREIQAAVARIAERYEISLVVRYDSESSEATDRGSVIKAINQEVVYQRHLDITKLVISQVNSPTVAAAGKPSDTSKN